jgi:hypothetical protein
MLVMLMQIMQLPPGSQDMVQGGRRHLGAGALAGKVAIRTRISRSDGATTASIRSAIPRTIFKDYTALVELRFFCGREATSREGS